MLAKLTRLKTLVEKVLPTEWFSNNKNDVVDCEGNLIASARFGVHADYISKLSPNELLQTINLLLETLEKQKRYVIILNELKNPLYFGGIAFNEHTGLEYICTSKIEEAISFHDRESAIRFMQSMDFTITGIKTAIIKVGEE